MSSVEVVIPFRDDGHRWPMLARVLTHFSLCLPGVPVRIVDAGGDRFNLSASRNLGVRTSTAPVVIVCDADTIIPVSQLVKSVELAEEAPGLVQPFDWMLHLGVSQVPALLRTLSLDPLPDGQRWDLSKSVPLLGSVNVLSRETWAAAGGWMESFEGWGCEDVAFEAQCHALVAPLRRVPGPAIQMSHPKAGVFYSPELTSGNAELMKTYLKARRHPQEMRRLCPPLAI